jgi:hypothetical protein
MDVISLGTDGVQLLKNSDQPTTVYNSKTNCVGSVFEFGGVSSTYQAQRKEYMRAIGLILGILPPVVSRSMTQNFKDSRSSFELL